MKVYIVSTVLPVLIFLVCCRSSEATRDNRASHRDATAIAAESTNVPTPQTVNNPTTIKPNASYVTAIVDSIHLLTEWENASTPIGTTGRLVRRQNFFYNSRRMDYHPG